MPPSKNGPESGEKFKCTFVWKKKMFLKKVTCIGVVRLGPPAGLKENLTDFLGNGVISFSVDFKIGLARWDEFGVCFGVTGPSKNQNLNHLRHLLTFIFQF